MKIAVASQNRREITGHTGRCRKFWIYEIENGIVLNKHLLEMPKEQSFHDSSPHYESPLDEIQVLIAGGMGTGLERRLQNKGIKPVLTTETNPDKAIESYLNGNLVTQPAEPHEHGHRHGDKQAK